MLQLADLEEKAGARLSRIDPIREVPVQVGTPILLAELEGLPQRGDQRACSVERRFVAVSLVPALDGVGGRRTFVLAAAPVAAVTVVPPRHVRRERSAPLEHRLHVPEPRRRHRVDLVVDELVRHHEAARS